MLIMTTSSNSLLAAGLTFMFAAYQAHADVVAIVSVDSTTTAITAEQISRIYLGESNMLVPFDIASPSSTRREFYAKVVGKDEGQAKAHWSRLVFAGKVSAPKEFPSGAEVVTAIAANPNAIGYVDRSFVNMTVKIVYTVK
jgi:ABC-type phosphate transport system substrate-binding protein